MAGRNEIELLIKARDEASRALTEVNKKIREIEGTAGGASKGMADLGEHMGNAERRAVSMSHGWISMAKGMLAAQAIMEAFNLTYEATIGLMIRGIKSIDDFNTAQASMAAAIASSDFKGGFEEAFEISKNINLEIDKLDRKFIGTADELRILADSMLTFGMGIDLSTGKAQDQFVAFGNMIKLLTRGQDFQRQAYQEIRSLMEGTNVQGALLVQKINAAGYNAKAMIPLWREQGVLLEKIMEILPGYEAAGKKIENTLQAQKSSLETITNRILREAMAPAYEDITNLVRGINDSLLDQNGLTDRGRALVDALKLAWAGVSIPVSAAAKALDWLLQGTIAYYNVTKNLVTMGKEKIFGVEGPTVEGLEMFYGSDLPIAGGLKVPGAKKRETEEEREKRMREELRKAKEAARMMNLSLKSFAGGLEDFYGYDKATESGEIDYLKSLEKQRENVRKGLERQEELEIRLKALRDEATTPVKWPWNENEIELAQRLNAETTKFAENVRRLNKEFDASERGEGPFMSKEQYDEAFKAYQDAYAASMRKVQEETDVTTKHVADAWNELFNGLGGGISDVFFDAFKGKLNSLGDYMDAFTDIVRRAWANLISDMIMEQLKLSFGSTAKGGLGSIAGLFGGLFGGGSSSALTEVGGMTEGLSMFYGYKDGGIIPGGFMPIRAFAGGGIADRPTFGIIGEAGDTEAVIPMKGGKVPVEMRGGSAPTNINFTIVAADASDMDRLLMDRRGLIMGMISDGLRNASPLRDRMRRSM